MSELNKKIEKTLVNTYNKIEDTIVENYKKVEDKVVETYNDIEYVFVDAFLKKDDETVEEAKERLKK